MNSNINRLELAQDVKDVQASALRVYAAKDERESKKAWADHQAVLDAFVAKYGSLRIRPLP